MDYKLLFVVVTLATVGLVMVYASTYHLGVKCLKHQFGLWALGMFVLFLGYKLNFNRLAGPRVRWALLVLVIGLLAAALILGIVVGVTKRNILGLLQPAEFTKYLLVIWLASYFADLKASKSKSLLRRWNGLTSFLIPGSVAAVAIGLTLAQPAVGTSVIMALACLALFVIAGVRKRYLLTTVLMVLIVFVLTVRFLPYAQKRWHDWRAGERYHQKQSLIALGSGRLFGRGLGEGRQKFYFLPHLHKDFIFATVGEEFGFVGCLAICLLYLILLYRGLKIGQEANSNFGLYLASGITIVIFLYAAVHMAVTLDLVPVTGQPLPFISYGGSALVANLFAAGVLLKISRFKRKGLDEAVTNSGWNWWPHLSRTGSGR
ncbi:MAG: FtsW/RodA/SpoVE family cell cycle protein [candidate division WOR-3 bacterium]